VGSLDMPQALTRRRDGAKCVRGEGKYDAGEVALPRRPVASGAVAPAYGKGSSFI